MKKSLEILEDAHTNMTTLEIIQRTFEAGYHGDCRVARSEAFERTLAKLISNEQQRLFRVYDKAKQDILK